VQSRRGQTNPADVVFPEGTSEGRDGCMGVMTHRCGEEVIAKRLGRWALGKLSKRKESGRGIGSFRGEGGASWKSGVERRGKIKMEAAC